MVGLFKKYYLSNTLLPCNLFVFHVLPGRYNLHTPLLTCKHCNEQWTPGVIDFERSGYWPATMQAQTLFHQDLFYSFEAMKTAAPGMSVKAFTALLDQRTKQFGRVSKNWNLKDHYVN